ncbi:hypothetical protein [Chitinimonas sp.]|uniref:hypothetical protein n=1 Tax=Chitinimonas sp. TaxID=1934313 RepID=UPI0035AE50B2
MLFAPRVFAIAAIYGILALLPLYFAEPLLNQLFPPAITHPEFYYAFLGVALAWQVAFVLIAREPARLRPIMLPAVLEKLGYGLALLTLFASGRLPAMAIGTAIGDLLFAVLFFIAWRKTPEPD